MLALWSRAAPSRTACRCRACFTRSTTAVSKRRLNVGDLFTACYSTILGTAVFADARVKEDRRKDWDRVIALAKADLLKEDAPYESPEIELSSAERELLDDAALETEAASYASAKDDRREEWDRITAQAGADLHDEALNERIETDMTVAESQVLDPGIERNTVEIWKSLGTWNQTPFTAIPPTMVDGVLQGSDGWIGEEGANEWGVSGETVASPVEYRDAKNQAHLEKMEEMVSKLVGQLLPQRGLLTSTTHETDVAVQLDEVFDRLELRCYTERLPSFQTNTERLELNSSVETLMKSIAANHSNLDLVLAKLCYNLLVSGSPPDIKTYNIMIRGFHRLKLHRFSQFVVDSFFEESKFKPSSETIQLILNHYSEQKDFSGFRGVVDRMRCARKDMRIRMQSVDQIERRDVQEWISAKNNKIMLKGAWLREKVTRDAGIFDSLINGFLHFDRIRTAIMYLRAAFRECVQISSPTFLRLVQACIDNSDNKSAIRIMRILQEGNLDQLTFDSKLRIAFHRLLALCGVEVSAPPSITNELGISSKTVQDIQRRMTLQSIDDQLDRLRVQVAEIQSLFGCEPGCERLITCPSELNIERAFRLLHDPAQKRAHIRMVNNFRTERLMLKARQPVSTNLVVSQRRKLPITWREKYDKLMLQYPGLPFWERREILGYFRQAKDIPQELRLYLVTRKWRKKEWTSCTSDVFWPEAEHGPSEAQESASSPSKETPSLPPVMCVSMRPIRSIMNANWGKEVARKKAKANA